MIPGLQSRTTEETVASATQIAVKADLVRITGATQVDTIRSPLMVDRGGLIIFVTPTDGNLVLGAGGNIAVGATLIQNRLHVLVYSSTAGKWYIHGVV